VVRQLEALDIEADLLLVEESPAAHWPGAPAARVRRLRTPASTSGAGSKQGECGPLLELLSHLDGLAPGAGPRRR
jgi:hypothetical protein